MLRLLKPASYGQRKEALSIGFVLTPQFTLLAFAGFIDTLRLAADEGDRSRPLRCQWAVMTANQQPVVSSCGVAVTPTDYLVDPMRFDYVVVVGGLLNTAVPTPTSVVDYIKLAAAQHVPLVGVCTGGFILARAGLMEDHTCCVSWFHHADFTTEFPNLQVVSDRIFLADRDRITCAGGVSVIQLASYLVDLHCGRGVAAKGLRIMIEDRSRSAAAPQPQSTLVPYAKNCRVRRAMLLIERYIGDPLTIDAVARQVSTTRRSLERMFRATIGLSPAEYGMKLQLDRARGLVVQSDLSMIQIAQECGFSDASHFSRRFRAAFGVTPREARQNPAGVTADLSRFLSREFKKEPPDSPRVL